MEGGGGEEGEGLVYREADVCKQKRHSEMKQMYQGAHALHMVQQDDEGAHLRHTTHRRSLHLGCFLFPTMSTPDTSPSFLFLPNCLLHALARYPSTKGTSHMHGHIHLHTKRDADGQPPHMLFPNEPGAVCGPSSLFVLSPPQGTLGTAIPPIHTHPHTGTNTIHPQCHTHSISHPCPSHPHRAVQTNHDAAAHDYHRDHGACCRPARLCAHPACLGQHRGDRDGRLGLPGRAPGQGPPGGRVHGARHCAGPVQRGETQGMYKGSSFCVCRPNPTHPNPPNPTHPPK